MSPSPDALQKRLKNNSQPPRLPLIHFFITAPCEIWIYQLGDRIRAAGASCKQMDRMFPWVPSTADFNRDFGLTTVARVVRTRGFAPFSESLTRWTVRL